jgi:hypothetical protein
MKTLLIIIHNPLDIMEISDNHGNHMKKKLLVPKIFYAEMVSFKKV